MGRKKKKRSRTIEDILEEAEEAAAQEIEEEPVVEPEPVRFDSGLKVGDKVSRKPITFGGAEETLRPRTRSGTVVYIHPKGRYHVVAFEVGHGVLRESFSGV